MEFSGPANSLNARIAAEQLDLTNLTPRATPQIPLDLTPDEIVGAFPGAEITEIKMRKSGEYETLTIAFSMPHEPHRSRIQVSIQRVPVETIETSIRMRFALFSRPISDLMLTSYRAPGLDLLADFAATDDYAIAVKGSFVTTVNGPDAKNIARTVTNLLFADQQ